MPLPAQQQQQTLNAAGGLFQSLLQITGSSAQVASATGIMASASPYVAAIYQAINLLPPGELKDWLQAGPIEFWKKIWTLVKGRKWTDGDYVLGERLNDQIYCNGDATRRQVSDEMVDLAHVIFNQLFGVRIATAEDLDALDAGVAAYKTRAVSQDMSTEAIERAVFLKKNYYPSSTYNVKCWDLRYFGIYPLVDRIPGYEIGKWYTGTVIGGAEAVDGIIPVSATDILDQYIGANFDPTTGTTTLPDGTVLRPGDSSGGGSFLDQIVSYVQTADPIVLIGIAVGAGYIYNQIDNNGGFS